MLPGVEVARRRRVRAGQGRDLDAYDGGGVGGGGGGGGGLGRAHADRTSHDTHRSRLTVTVSSHHHHHHHHHVHSRHGNPSSRPGTPRPGSLVRRMQDVLQELQEHRLQSSLAPTRSSSERVQVIESTTSSHSHSHNHSHSHSHNSSSGSASSSSSNRVSGYRSGAEYRDGHFASRWRRQAAGTFSDLRGAALEARNRLDERLRAAAHASSNRLPEAARNRRNLAAVPYSPDMNIYYSDDEDDSLWSDDDGWETSLHEWLAAWAPSVQESWPPWPRVDSPSSSSRSQETWPSWPRVDLLSSSSSRSTPSSNSRSYKAKPSEGLSEAAIKALPLDVVGQNGDTGKLEQEDCPVCLEGVLPGQQVITLPCRHRFHPECLTPWLSNHGQCPYCRAEIVKENVTPEVKSRTVHEDQDHVSWVEVIERGMDRLNYS